MYAPYKVKSKCMEFLLPIFLRYVIYGSPFFVILMCNYDILIDFLQSAHAVLQFQDQGKQVYKVKNVSLNTLCEMYNATVNPMKDQLKNVYRRDQKYWARRPLTRDMLLYAAGDVLILINEQLYLNMSK